MNKEEGRIIRENPLRILGVFSDTPKKEIVANIGKLRAFAKTGKILDFDTDFTTLLGPVARTIESIEKANNDIALPKDKLQAGMFWFMQHTDNDKAAIECLKLGNPDEAMTIIQKKGNYSGVVNMAVLALILKKWDIALYSYAYLLESPMRRGALIKAFTDSEDYFSEEELVEYISNKLIQDFPNANWLDQIQHENVVLGEKSYPFKSRFEGSKLLDQLTERCVLQIKKDIDSIISEASSIARKDAMANLAMAKQIEERCKPMLKELRLALGKGNNVYIEYADNVANQILDNCIDYYTHDTGNPQRAQNVIKFTRYAYRTAEGKTTKERAKKNLDILSETLDNLIPESIQQEYNNIDNQVMYFKHNESSVDSDGLYTIVDYCCKQIDSIKDKIGATNKHYISISTNFASFVDQTIIKRVNNLLSQFPKNISQMSLTQVSEALKMLEWAYSLYNKTGKYIISENLQLSDKDNPAVIFAHNRYDVGKQLDVFKKEYNKRTYIHIDPYKIGNTQRQNSQKTNTNSSNSSPYSQNYSRQSTSKEPSKQNDNTLGYIFGALGMILIVFMLVISLSNKHQKDNTVAKATESAYNTDYSKNSEESENETTLETDETTNEADGTTTVEPETSANYNEEIESFTTVSFSTGDRPYQSTYGKGNYDNNTQNSLLIKNGSSTDAVVFLERTNGKKVRHVYIERGQNFTMTKIPGGEYIIKVMQGTDWNPEKDNGSGNPKGGFMYSCSISKSESYDAFDYPYPSSGQYGQYEVTLYKVQNGNMQTESINENDLF